MLSPKDAFLMYNTNKTGKMTFDEFSAFFKSLCQVAGLKVSSYYIIKDLFEFIDIRKDGVIDLFEWMQTF